MQEELELKPFKNKEVASSIHYMMKKIRMVEERIAKEYPLNEIRCPTHLSIGQEAVPAALSVCLNPKDFAVSTHRGHAHYLAKQGNLNKMIAEIYGKKSGCSGGKGGSMHLIDKEAGFMGTSAIVGNSIPVGVGLGFAQKLNKSQNISCIFLGDGAIEEGVFYESLNFAALKNLPVLFICENNFYSVYSSLSVRQPENRKIYSLAKSLGAKTFFCDGNDALQSYKVLNEVVRQMKNESCATWFLEFQTYRWREHCGYQYDNDLGYRSNEEFEFWKKKDPIPLFEKSVQKIFPEFDNEYVSKVEENLSLEINNAFEKAKNDSFPEECEKYKNVYAREL